MNRRQRKKHAKKFPREGVETLYGVPVCHHQPMYGWTRVKQRVGQRGIIGHRQRFWRQVVGYTHRVKATIGFSQCALALRAQQLKSAQHDPQQEFRWLRDAMLKIASGTRYPRKRKKQRHEYASIIS